MTANSYSVFLSVGRESKLLFHWNAKQVEIKWFQKQLPGDKSSWWEMTAEEDEAQFESCLRSGRSWISTLFLIVGGYIVVHVSFLEQTNVTSSFCVNVFPSSPD